MATTTSQLSDSRQLDERELRAWRGMLRAHAALTKALDADLDAAHGLPLSSYEVLLHLDDADGRRMRMRDLAASVILSRSRPHAPGRPPRARGADPPRVVPERRARRRTRCSRRPAPKLAAARTTHLAGVRSLFLQHFSDDELEVLGDAWDRVVPGVGLRARPDLRLPSAAARARSAAARTAASDRRVPAATPEPSRPGRLRRVSSTRMRPASRTPMAADLRWPRIARPERLGRCARTTRSTQYEAASEARRDVIAAPALSIPQLPSRAARRASAMR